jgi:hypothetical protein
LNFSNASDYNSETVGKKWNLCDEIFKNKHIKEMFSMCLFSD